MRWEELTGDTFPEAVAAAEGVCLLPLSVIERHGHHLPLGTDMYIGRELCRRVAEIEKTVIFPDFIFTQILEAQHVPGTIAIDPELMVRLLENVFSEIARNGLTKIVIVNAHGGNGFLIHYLAQIQLKSQRDYVVYVVQPTFQPDEESAYNALWSSEVDGHAGESETSAILAVRPDLVHRDKLSPDGEGLPLGRLQTLRDMGVSVGIWWYGDHPTHYRGDGTPATAEKGNTGFDIRAKAFARVIHAIKEDTETKRLQDEFFAAFQHGHQK
jgi:creatinine amidohydrolase